MTTLLGISGSLRKDSTNTKLVRAAAKLFAADTFIEANLRIPLYDGDLEADSGVPTEAQTLADQIKSADAIIISTPEYNKAIPGVLKNALDWVSRTEGAPWLDKPVAIVSATAGGSGGVRAQFDLRLAMTAFRPNLLQGPEVILPQSFNAFADDGTLTNEMTAKGLAELMEELRKRV